MSPCILAEMDATKAGSPGETRGGTPSLTLPGGNGQPAWIASIQAMASL